VIAVEDGTMLANWSGGAPTRLDAGERVRWRIDSAARISATKPVVAMQYERGRMCDGAEAGDPSMVQLRPLASDTSLFVVGARGLTFARYFLTVIMPTADTASLYSLGTVRLGPFRTFPDDPAHAWIRLEAHGGVFPVRGRSIVGAVSHGAGPAVSYAADLTRVPSSVLRELTIRQECTCEGVVLEASEGFASYRWSTGDTTRTIVARASGSYSVVGTSDDCMLASSPVSVDVAPMPSVRFEPRTVTVDAGEIIPMTLVVDRGDQAGACALTLRAVALRFRASMLVPEAVVGGRIVGDSIAGADRIITLEASRDTVLLDMVAAFGDTTTIAVTLDAIVSDSCVRSAGDTLALITFTGCEVGGRRLFLDRDAAAIKPVRIAGGASSIAVAYRTLEEGPTRLELVDPLGRRLAVVVDATLAPGEHTAVIDIAELAAGSYTLVLVTPSRQIVERFIITR
jgi:hypothetical protein